MGDMQPKIHIPYCGGMPIDAEWIADQKPGVRPSGLSELNSA
jgi:hypothetical protein